MKKEVILEFENVTKELIYKMVEYKVIDIGFRTKKLNYEPNAIGVVEFRPDNYDQIPPYDFKSHPIV